MKKRWKQWPSGILRIREATIFYALALNMARPTRDFAKKAKASELLLAALRVGYRLVGMPVDTPT